MQVKIRNPRGFRIFCIRGMLVFLPLEGQKITGGNCAHFFSRFSSKENHIYIKKPSDRPMAFVYMLLKTPV